MVARYTRGFDPTWFYIHTLFQIVGFLCIVAGVATGIELAKDFQPDHLAAHRGLGMFLFGLAILQVLYRASFYLVCSRVIKTVFHW